MDELESVMSPRPPVPEATAGPSAQTSCAGAETDQLGRWAPAAAGLAFGTVVLIALFWDTAAAMVGTWRDSNLYAHGFLIVPIAGFLCWRRRRALARSTPAPWLWGLVAMAAAAFAWVLGAAAGTLVVQQLALVAMVQALAVTVLGPRVSKILAVPLLYLTFAAPFGSFLIAPLQDLTARFTVVVLQLVGVPVRVDGLLLHIPSASFVVAEACAGVRFLLSTLALSVLAADLFYRSWTRWLAFMALALAVPVGANVLRASSIILIAHWSGPQAAVAFDHVTYGLVFLGFVMLCLFALGLTFRETASRAPTDVAAAPLGRARSPWSSVLATAGALAVAAGASWAGVDQPAVIAKQTAVALAAPAVQQPWRAVPATGSRWRPDFPGAHGELRQSFARGDRRVDLYVAYYAYQRQGAEVVSETNRFEDGKSWVGAEAGRRQAAVDGAPLTLAYRRLLSAGQGRVVWYWYWVDGRFTSNPYVAKALQAKVRLLGGASAAAVVAIAAEEDPSPEAVDDLLGDFLKHAGPLRDMLRRAAAAEELQ
jgi:exosortase A